MKPTNCIFNHNFQYPPNSVGRWPPGWERVGGNQDSSWKRVTDYAQDGRYCLLIENPTDKGFCGIRESPPEIVPALPGEKWRAIAAMRVEKPGKGRMSVAFLDACRQMVSVQKADLEVTDEMREYAVDYFIPAGAAESVVEVGIVGPNRMWIDRVCKSRVEISIPQAVGVSHDNASFHCGPQRLNAREGNYYFVAVSTARTLQAKVQFGRHLSFLAIGKQEHITFSPATPLAISLHEIYFNSTGPVILEFAAGHTKELMRYELPGTEIYLYLPVPLRVTFEGPPLVVKVANRSQTPLCYTLLVTGVADSEHKSSMPD